MKGQNYFLGTALFAVVLLLIGCPSVSVAPERASANIDSAGGELVSSDGEVVLVFPAGAVTTEIEVSIEVVADYEHELLVTKLYRLEPSGQTFDVPVVLRLAFDEPPTASRYPAIAKVVGEDLLLVAGSLYDHEAGRLVAELSSFSLYGGFAFPTSDPCEGKQCGDYCSSCYSPSPDDENCMTVMSYCDQAGECVVEQPVCEPEPDPCADLQCGDTCYPPLPEWCFEDSQGDPPMVCDQIMGLCDVDGVCGDIVPVCPFEPGDWGPCAEKQCGTLCTVCHPDDPDCIETTVIKQCNLDGECSAGTPACDEGETGYDPCADKVCGAPCTTCDPRDSTCVETTVIKLCDANGACRPDMPACDADEPSRYDPCEGKACAETCTLCSPTDPDCVETTVLKQCNVRLLCGMTTPVCD